MEHTNIFLFARWQVKEGQMATVLELLPALVANTRKEKGNLQYHIYQNNTDGNQLLLFEAYRDKDAVDAHRSSDHFKQIVLEQIVPLLESREAALASELDF